MSKKDFQLSFDGERIDSELFSLVRNLPSVFGKESLWERRGLPNWKLGVLPWSNHSLAWTMQESNMGRYNTTAIKPKIRSFYENGHITKSRMKELMGNWKKLLRVIKMLGVSDFKHLVNNQKWGQIKSKISGGGLGKLPLILGALLIGLLLFAVGDVDGNGN